MAVARISSNRMIDESFTMAESGSHFLRARDIESNLHEQELPKFCSTDTASANELLLKSTRSICQRYRIEFSQLSQIQRKFITHYRCTQCGLLPLYHINLLHVKRVRCKKCGQLTGFTAKGKYGKLRKAIAFEIASEIKGDVERVQ